MRTIACHDGLLYKRATASCVVLWNAVHEVRTVACRACGIARRGNSCCAVVRRRVALDEAGAKTRVALDEAGARARQVSRDVAERLSESYQSMPSADALKQRGAPGGTNRKNARRLANFWCCFVVVLVPQQRAGITQHTASVGPCKRPLFVSGRSGPGPRKRTAATSGGWSWAHVGAEYVAVAVVL